MADSQTIRIAVISDNPDPNWVWIRDLMGGDFKVAGRPLDWQCFSMGQPRFSGASAKPARPAKILGRWRGARALAKAARKHPFDLIVSHGPWVSAWTEALSGIAKKQVRHLAFSFNFTDLPTGLRKILMKRSFKSIDDFAVFTDAERGLYADYFSLDPQKIWRAPWGVAPPLKILPPSQFPGGYVAALGGEARDYETLCETARLCPETQFIAIARPHNFDGLKAPENLQVLFNLPFEEAWGIIGNADAAIIPLRSQETPCGLVTLIGTMHLGKAQIVTKAVGVSDYIEEGKTGLLTPPQDAEAMAEALRHLQLDEAFAQRLGDNAQAFATLKCSEAATVAFFKDLLGRWFD